MIYGVNVRYVVQVREHKSSRTRVTQLLFLLLEVFSSYFPPNLHLHACSSALVQGNQPFLVILDPSDPHNPQGKVGTCGALCLFQQHLEIERFSSWFHGLK